VVIILEGKNTLAYQLGAAVMLTKLFIAMGQLFVQGSVIVKNHEK
jgi:hypothetical protein